MGEHPLNLGGGPGDFRFACSLPLGFSDPTTRNCTMASAGHLPPVRITPEGTAAPLKLPIGPPLGTGGLPHEYAEFDLDPGSTLALFTDGLLTAEYDDLDTG
ncbi:PP2C family protein-serine/threonine phosphatase, partial [Streptomyces fuscichromogenes]|uniref:PP2C family protein-serine/threonine phosphatase n=1 Tax=Streptomyces fuscichromogenes TaxID=1324013 RepID=UPI00381FE5E2